MKFQHHTEDGTAIQGSSRLQEQEDGTFKLVWASKSSECLGGCYKKTKFDIVRPGRYYHNNRLLHKYLMPIITCIILSGED